MTEDKECLFATHQVILFSGSLFCLPLPLLKTLVITFGPVQITQDQPISSLNTPLPCKVTST